MREFNNVFDLPAHRAIEPPELSLIVPCYNEREVLPLLEQRLQSSLEDLGMDWEVIFVDDGSTDGTFELLLAMHMKEERFKVVGLSRNFGHQTAISAGLNYATGALVGMLDADLQDPPELLGRCIETLSSGYDVVYAIRRNRRENWLKRAAYASFYRLFRLLTNVHMPLDSGDFCVMTRQVAQVLRAMTEREAFIRGLRAWVGFRQVGIEYNRPMRAGGRSKYSWTRLLKLALDGLFSFSVLPLRLAIFLGMATTVLAVGWAALHVAWRIIGFRLMGHTAAELPGWTLLMCGMFFLGGVQLLILGCVGEYVGRIFNEIKGRPRWVERANVGFHEIAGRERFTGERYNIPISAGPV